jgi:hypothetical protein
LHILISQLSPLSGSELTSQPDRSEPDAYQTAYRHALRFPEPPYFTISAFSQNDMKPMIDTASTGIQHLVETGLTVFQHDTAAQPIYHLSADFTAYAYGILPFDSP